LNSLRPLRKTAIIAYSQCKTEKDIKYRTVHFRIRLLIRVYYFTILYIHRVLKN